VPDTLGNERHDSNSTWMTRDQMGWGVRAEQMKSVLI